MKFVMGDRVEWTDRRATPGSVGTLTNRTKAGAYRASPDARGYWLVEWDGGVRRWCTQLKKADEA